MVSFRLEKFGEVGDERDIMTADPAKIKQSQSPWLASPPCAGLLCFPTAGVKVQRGLLVTVS